MSSKSCNANVVNVCLVVYRLNDTKKSYIYSLDQYEARKWVEKKARLNSNFKHWVYFVAMTKDDII